MHFIPFLRGKLYYFFIALIIYFGILILILILFVVMILRFKSKKYNFLWPLYILKYCLPIIFITFFGQTFILILSVYECTNGITFYDEKYSCPNKKAFRILYPLTVFPIIIQIFFGFITVTLYFIPDYISINNNNSILVKRNTLSDISFLFCKIIIIAFFIFDK